MLRRFVRNNVIKLHEALKVRGYRRRTAVYVKKAGLKKDNFNKAALKGFMELWSPLTNRPDINSFMMYTHLNGSEDPRFLPMDLYYCTIEPILNNKRFIKGYSDKNALDLFHQDVKAPFVLLRSIDGIIYDHAYRRIQDNRLREYFFDQAIGSRHIEYVFVKPSSDTMQGLSTLKLKVDDGRLYDEKKGVLDLHELRKLYPENFIIQEYIHQHECTARFHNDSLNTIRVLTYRSVRDDTIVPLQILQKVGKGGSIIDKGFRIGMSPDGNYNKYCTEGGKKHTDVNGLNLSSISGFPYIRDLIRCAENVAKKHIHSRILGLDLAVNRHGEVLLIEVNNIYLGHEATQINNGPLFREYTEEIIDYCKDKKRTFSFYFDV